MEKMPRLEGRAGDSALSYRERWVLGDEKRCLLPEKFRYSLHPILLGLLELERGFRCTNHGPMVYFLIAMIVIINAY